MRRRRSGIAVFVKGSRHRLRGEGAGRHDRHGPSSEHEPHGSGVRVLGKARTLITTRDTEIVEWIARTGVVEASHVTHVFGLGRTVTYRRLAALETARLIERTRVLHGRPAMIVATRAGLRLVGLEHLGLSRVSAATALHWQSSSLIAALIEADKGRGKVGSVREIRAYERSAKQRIASTTIGAAAHHPDLVLWGADGVGATGGHAYEIELTVKAPERLRAILRGWRNAVRDFTVDHVTYVCTPEAKRAVTRAVDATRTHSAIRVLDMPELDVLHDLAKPTR